MPTKAAHRPLLMKSAIVSRSVGMPALRALTLSPPMAKIQLPKREKSRMKPTIRTIAAIHQNRVTWNLPPR